MANGFQLISTHEECTKNTARTIASFFRPGDVVVLDGDLGAGKTHFVKGFAEGLHSTDTVTSPTFAIANFYRTDAFSLLHIDLYRIETIDEFNDLGLSDYFDSAIVLIEWGLKFPEYPDEYLLVSFELKDGGDRLISFGAKGGKYDLILERMRNELC
ncbi:MAG: tRNA (adenosine(37)-N6)-threonylcarbamoyltransferase complex ATPase subunit type 1 TsaE [Tannerella sp.]|jgi:tRNA threonylcarbamoyladenosine biosynthesis protein TsaE|nr:tRNA (adenosine(37)-N6)-threonylcarbamoyltransferase complex ATPase subunit type 1 TsaE [Tannerella sp.]